MGWFTRKKDADVTLQKEVLPEELQERREVVNKPAADKKHGPYDISERKIRPGYLDMGPLKIMQLPGVALRLDVAPDRQTVLGVSYPLGSSDLNLAVFAAPRSGGLWREIRESMADQMVADGGRAEIVTSCFGKEIRAQIPVQSPDGKRAVVPIRVIGVEGPRWFLRAMIRGPLAMAPHDPNKLNPAENILSATIVDRGSEPMPPRKVLALQPPTARIPGAATAALSLDPNDARGPEITEIR
ncbi:DUF3710 domain-containing protein [Buchananella felis]|uniref:DUF3710 domain-containing protein n=1 Tax=Buchananella felis TaxID=3231492 RepID=UPI0035285DC0